jgi:hypothetical protein
MQDGIVCVAINEETRVCVFSHFDENLTNIMSNKPAQA